MKLYKRYSIDRDYVLHCGDCMKLLRKIPSESFDLTITSPPYFMGKDYDKSARLDDFISFHKELLPEIVRITKNGRSICWQVGYHVKDGVVTPLDYVIHDIMKGFNNVFLRNRIVWNFGHGLHGRTRFSGRHELVMWYTKGLEYYFDLDEVRVPQKYPGKRYYKGPNKGKYSGNPLGKNPSDVWEIPNVKANHVEKTLHPCQFPVALAQRLVRALSPTGSRIFDPFIGSGTTAIAAIIEKRKFVGCEIEKKYYEIARSRCLQALSNKVRYRPADKPVFEPSSTMSVAKRPLSFS